MKAIVTIWMIFLVLPSCAFAQRGGDACDIQGKRDFTISFDVLADDSAHSVTLDQGNHGYALWHTDASQLPPQFSGYERIFNDPNLVPGERYNIVIVHDNNADTLSYYRKLNFEPPSSYVLYNTRTLDLKPGKYEPVGSEVVTCSNQIERPVPPPILPGPDEVCSAFKSPAQTWYDENNNGNGRLYIAGQGGENSAQIREAAIDASSGKRLVGFDEEKVSGDITGPPPEYHQINAGCDQERCWGDSNLKVPRETLATFPASREVSVTPVNSNEKWSVGRQVEGTLSVGGRGVLTLMSGTYWVDRIELNAGGQILVPEGEQVILNVKEMSIGGFLGMDIADIERNGQYQGYLRVNVYDLPMKNTDANLPKVSFNGSAIFIGLLYSEAADSKNIWGSHVDAVQLTNNAKVYGAITAVSTQLNSSAQLIASSSCLEPEETEKNYTLVLSPQSDIALVCEDINTTLTVFNNGQLASDFQGEVVVNIDGVEQKYSGVSNSLSIQSDGASKVVAVSAFIEGEQDSTLVSGSYEFVPFKFGIEDHYIIANKPQQVVAKTLACNDGGDVVDIGYQGSPKVQFSWLTPASGASGELIYAPQFTSGKAHSELVLDESGKAQVSLEERNFDCSGLKDCPIAGQSTLKGKFMLYSRPWTFALCPSGEHNIYAATGTSDGGNAFIAAGEAFDIRVLPIKYQAAINGEVESDRDWCTDSHITRNFFLDNAFDNHIKLSSQVVSPIPYMSTTLLDSKNNLTQARVNRDDAYYFTDLYWNDVGSLKVMVASENHDPDCASPVGLEGWYECTQSGYRNIGRFYPDHFTITETHWGYPEDQNHSVYMNQNFRNVEFSVSAYGASGQLTHNYGLFDDGLKVNFLLFGEYAKRLNIDDELEFTQADWHGATWRKSWLDSVQWSKLTSPDGPFNSSVDPNSITTELGLVLRDVKDPSYFQYEHLNPETQEIEHIRHERQTLLEQPNVRYGRINLSDVGGQVGTKLTVPLKVEYWNGNRFVVNTYDESAEIEAIKSRDEVIWPSPTDGAACSIALKAVKDDFSKPDQVDEITSASVSEGELPNREGHRLVAYQDCDAPNRQQSEVELSLEPTTGNNMPWFKYDWDNDGEEENPAAVITFGIYRGNDRIIYRGEPGLTAP